MEFAISAPTLVGFVMALVRAVTWLMVAPPFNGPTVPFRIKVGFAAGLAMALGPRLGEQGVPLETGALIGAVVMNVIAGAALGFIAYMLFMVFQTAGSIIDLFGAFAVSSALDPLSGNQGAVMSRVFNMMATVLLFATGGHLLLVRGFLTSYEALPLDGFRSDRLAEIVTHDMGLFFLGALEIAAPLVAALFLTDIALGLLARAAPEMNVFLLGLPLKVFITVSAAALMFPAIPGALGDLTDQAVRHGLSIGGG